MEWGKGSQGMEEKEQDEGSAEEGCGRSGGDSVWGSLVLCCLAGGT